MKDLQRTIHTNLTKKTNISTRYFIYFILLELFFGECEFIIIGAADSKLHFIH